MTKDNKVNTYPVIESTRSTTAQESLPDLVAPNLDVLFVGINPSLYSVAMGHYFARKANRFWPALSRSSLSVKAREGLGVEQLCPEHDVAMLDYGFGFTDAVKRATARASEISPQEFAGGVAALASKIEVLQPKIACFQGIMGYRPIFQALTGTKGDPQLGLQSLRIGTTRIFLCPSPSPANARFTLADQVRSYDELALCMRE